MIETTRVSDTLCRKGFGPSNVMISSLNSIMEKMKLDPTVSSPVNQAFIIASKDVRNKHIKAKFVEVLKGKHPNVRVVYLADKNDTLKGGAEGIDQVLINPQPADLADAVYAMIEGGISEKEPVVSSMDSVVEKLTEHTPQFDEIKKEESSQVLVGRAEELELVEETPEELVEEPLVVPAAEETVGDVDTIQSRLKQCGSVASIASFTKNLSVAEVTKEVARMNAKYTSYELKLRVLQEKIFNVFADRSLNDKQKMDRIQALVYEVEGFRDENASMLSKRVEEIVDTIVSQTRVMLDKHLSRVDKQLMTDSLSSGNLNYAKFADISEKRANMMLETLTLDAEVRTIYESVDGLCQETAAVVASNATEKTGSPLVDNHLEVYGGNSATEKTLGMIYNILSKSNQTSEEFKSIVDIISKKFELLDNILGKDKEAIDELYRISNFLKANNVEDTVLAKTLLKRSLRVFVANEGSGRTVVPLILGKLKSRENCNTLVVDLTGTSKAKEYNENVIDFDSWMISDLVTDDFVYVAGGISEGSEVAQRLMTKLMKAADYFRSITLVLSPEQYDILENLSSEVLVVNFLLETRNKDIEQFKDVMAKCTFPNVGKRVIINKCSVDVQTVVEKLGLMEDLNVQVVKIPYISTLQDCALHQIKPYEVSEVKEIFKEALRLC